MSKYVPTMTHYTVRGNTEAKRTKAFLFCSAVVVIEPSQVDTLSPSPLPTLTQKVSDPEVSVKNCEFMVKECGWDASEMRR